MKRDDINENLGQIKSLYAEESGENSRQILCAGCPDYLGPRGEEIWCVIQE